VVDYFNWSHGNSINCERLYFYSTLCRVIYQSDHLLWRQIKEGIDGIERIEMHNSTTVNGVSWVGIQAKTGSAIVITGTTNDWQKFFQVGVIQQVRSPFYPGLVCAYDNDREFEIDEGVMNFLFRIRGLPVTTCGHSLGGAVSQLLAHRIQRQPWGRLAGCVTQGSKQVGNWTYADETTFPLVQLFNTGDPIPLWPPGMFGFPYSWIPREKGESFFPGGGVYYRHAGIWAVMDSSGNMTLNRWRQHVGDGPPLREAIQAPRIADPFWQHYASEYTRRIRTRLGMLHSSSALRQMINRRVLDEVNLELNKRDGINWRWDPTSGLPTAALIDPFAPTPKCGCSR